MFEWDERKRRVTIEKHKIDFLDAIEIFGGPVLVLAAKSEIEARKRVVAPLGEKVICVVFTIRGDAIRIITARVARRNEREAYQDLYPGTGPRPQG